jgi:PilZ domain
MQERRSGPRKRVFKGAKIILNDGRSVIDCVLRNLSETGVRITVDNAAAIPPVFDLLIEGESQPRHCRRSWLSDRSLGVLFTPKPASGEQSA